MLLRELSNRDRGVISFVKHFSNRKKKAVRCKVFMDGDQDCAFRACIRRDQRGQIWAVPPTSKSHLCLQHTCKPTPAHGEWRMVSVARQPLTHAAPGVIMLCIHRNTPHLHSQRSSGNVRALWCQAKGPRETHYHARVRPMQSAFLFLGCRAAVTSRLTFFVCCTVQERASRVHRTHEG